MKATTLAIGMMVASVALTSFATAQDVDVTDSITRTVEEINAMDQMTEHGALVLNGEAQAIVSGREHNIDGYILFNTIDHRDLKNISGFIHSHPKSQAADPEERRILDEMNQNPSRGDLGFAGFMCQIVTALGGYQPDITLYVIGPDDVARAAVLECQ